MSARRYTLRDSAYEDDPSMRDTSRTNSETLARRWLAESVPPGRFYVWDRERKEAIHA